MPPFKPMKFKREDEIDPRTNKQIIRGEIKRRTNRMMGYASRKLTRRR